MNIINRVDTEPEVYGGGGGAGGSIQECERNKKCESAEVFRFTNTANEKFCKMCNIRLCIVVSQHNTLKRILNSPVGFKPTRPVKYLGCCSSQFRKYIKSKMVDGMEWDNIHLDHIKPVNAFDLDDEEQF
jgi:hypothetical protein